MLEMKGFARGFLISLRWKMNEIEWNGDWGRSKSVIITILKGWCIRVWVMVTILHLQPHLFIGCGCIDVCQIITLMFNFLAEFSILKCYLDSGSDLLLVVWEDGLQDAVGHHQVNGAQLPAKLVRLDGQPLRRGGGRGSSGRGGGAAGVKQLIYQGLKCTNI